jgi:hypothetical protein
MDSDPSQIPVVPIPFEHGLIHFARSLARGQTKIVAIGSSTTVGRGDIAAYPGRLLSFLQKEYPKANTALVNKGIGGQEAPLEFQRFDTDWATHRVAWAMKLAIVGGVDEVAGG